MPQFKRRRREDDVGGFDEFAEWSRSFASSVSMRRAGSMIVLFYSSTIDSAFITKSCDSSAVASSTTAR